MTAKYYKEICEIESVSLGFEDHGILTAMVRVRYSECADWQAKVKAAL